MNLTNIFINLVSLTNLTIFLNRLIHDGQYKSVLLIHDNESIRDTNFIQELSNSSNRNYYTLVIACVSEFDSPEWMLEFNSQSFMNVLSILMVEVDMIHPKQGFPIFRHCAFAHNMVVLLPMRRNRKNIDFLRYFFNMTKGRTRRFSLIFYQTPNTIQNAVSNKSIEVFVMSSRMIAYERPVFGIHVHGDIHSQLSSTKNVTDEVFEPIGVTFLLLVNNDMVRNVSNILNRTDVMSDSQNIFMANYIVRKMKNLTTLQVVLSEIGANKNVFLYTSSNRSIYAELSISTLDYRYKAEKYKST